jgi:hypothetical protein
MLGRKNYTREEIDHARATVAAQLASFDQLAAATTAGHDKKATAALDALTPVYFDNVVLVLDRLFVHRIRPVTGKDTNPLNEVELLAESLLQGTVLRTNKVIKWEPAKSVLGLKDGDPIALSRADVARLADAFLAEVEARFL